MHCHFVTRFVCIAHLKSAIVETKCFTVVKKNNKKKLSRKFRKESRHKKMLIKYRGYSVIKTIKKR